MLDLTLLSVELNEYNTAFASTQKQNIAQNHW